MTDMVVPDAHASDGDLVRYVDGEGGPEERASLRAHVDACGECAARLARLQRRTERLAEMLKRADYPVPAMASPQVRRAPVLQPWMRAAAVVALAIGVGTVWSAMRTGGGDRLPNAALERGPAPKPDMVAAEPDASTAAPVAPVAPVAPDSAADAGKEAQPEPPSTAKPGDDPEAREQEFQANGRAAAPRPRLSGGVVPAPIRSGGSVSGLGAASGGAGAPAPVTEDLVVTAAPPPPPPPPPPAPAAARTAAPAPQAPVLERRDGADQRGDRGREASPQRVYDSVEARQRSQQVAQEEKRNEARAEEARSYRMARVPASRLVFAPTGDVLHVKVAHAQAAGAVVLLAPQGTQGAAEVAGALGPDLGYEPGVVRIANPEDATADYRIRLPGTIRRVLVSVGDGKPIEVDATAIEGSRRIELRVP